MDQNGMISREEFLNFAKVWTKEKELERNHVAHEMALLCMVMDRMVESQSDFAGTQGCEILASLREPACVRTCAEIHMHESTHPSLEVGTLRSRYTEK